MTVSAQTTVNSSTANGVTTVFPYAFKILRDADLEVLVDGVVKTLSTHYTVSGAGNNSGGDVTFLSAPAADAIVVRRRNMQLVRSVDYQYQGDLPNSVLNPDLDAPILIAQQLQEQVGRAARGPAGETWTELPAAADRIDKFLVFDEKTGEAELSTVTQTQVASAVAAAYAAGSTADAVTFLQAGTGAESRSVQAKLREYVSISDFGVLGAGNDAAILQEAINAVQGTSAAILIPGNTTIALGTTPVTSAGSVRLIGLGGKDRTYITWTSTTMTAWAHTGGVAGGLILEGITFSGPVSCTAGGAISVNSLSGVACAGVNIHDCAFVNGFRQLYMPQAHSWEITGNTFTDYVECGLYTANTITVGQDEGDSYFSNNGMFAGVLASAKGIVQAGAGGLKVIGNKMYGGQYGYYMDLDSGVDTSILIIQGNSIEFQLHSGVRLRNTAGGASFTQIVINGNQFAAQPTPINLDHASSCFVAATISDNIIGAAAGAGTTCAITVTTTPLSIITGNIVYGTGTTVLGLTIGSGSFSTREENNQFYGCVTEVSNSVSNGVASATSITLPIWTDVIIVTGTTNITSIASASNHRNRTVTLMFQGILTFTDGNNLKLAGNFVTTADDTITLCCADGTNWYEVCRSVN